jgi:hypothetical protein
VGNSESGSSQRPFLRPGAAAQPKPLRTDESDHRAASNPVMDEMNRTRQCVGLPEVIAMNGPILLEMARSGAHEREREANASALERQVNPERAAASSVPARFARAWAALWALATADTPSGRRRHDLGQHGGFEGR